MESNIEKATGAKTIILYGVPGSGKTSLARILSEKLKLPHLEADEVRKIGERSRTLEADPFFFLPTTEAYKAVGPRTPENVVQGFLGVRDAYRDLVAKEIDSREGRCVAEAAFLDPASLKDRGMAMLVVVPSEEKHRSQFLEHRTEEAFANGQFENARIIQNFLIDEAHRLSVPVIENAGDMEFLVRKAEALIFEEKYER